MRLQIGSAIRCPWIAEVGGGFVSLTSVSGEWGRVSMNTTVALHTYRLEGDLATDVSRVYVDGQLVLTGGPSGAVCDFVPGAPQSCIFGHLYPTSSGVSEWEYVRHNLGTGVRSYCGGGHMLNSVGQVVALTSSGSTIISADDMTLRAVGLPIGSFGYFLNSLEYTSPAPLAFGQGVLCLGSGIGRFNRPGEILNAGQTGMVELVLDVNDMPTPQGAVGVARATPGTSSSGIAIRIPSRHRTRRRLCASSSSRAQRTSWFRAAQRLMPNQIVRSCERR